MLYGTGISRPHELVDLGTERGIVEKGGTWFAVSGERLGPGRDKAAEMLKQNPEMLAGLEKAIRAAAQPAPAVVAVDAAA